MACIILWSSAVKVHDSQAYGKIGVCRGVQMSAKGKGSAWMRVNFLSGKVPHLPDPTLTRTVVIPRVNTELFGER